MLRVLIVDDHPTVRLGLSHLLAANDIEVVGEAGTTDEAVRLAESLRPDLVLLDLRLAGGGSGVEACREIKALPGGVAPPRVLVFTAHTRAEDVAGATLAGADGYMHKGATGEELLDAVRRVGGGGRVWLLPTDGDEAGAASRLQKISNQVRLMPKEREVFALVLKRRTNPEISQQLYISLYTVKNHVSSILRKLGLKSRREIS